MPGCCVAIPELHRAKNKLLPGIRLDLDLGCGLEAPGLTRCDRVVAAGFFPESKTLTLIRVSVWVTHPWPQLGAPWSKPERGASLEHRSTSSPASTSVNRPNRTPLVVL